MRLFLVLSSLLICIGLSSAFNKQCERRTSECKLLSHCPAQLALIKAEQFDRVRKNICGFEGVKSLVCCDISGDAGTTEGPFVIETPKTPKLTLEEKKKLLPQDICGRPSTDDKVIGGEPAPIGAYPWVVALGYDVPGKPALEFHCGGAMINSRYVLTAAHCVSDKYLSGRKLKVIHLGDYDLKNERDCQVVPVFNFERCAPPKIVARPDKIIMHEQFDTRKRFSDDIALIRLDISIDFRTINSYIAPVCVPGDSVNVRTLTGGRDTIAAGWGFTEDNSQSDILLRVNLPLADEKLCTDRYRDQFIPGQLCVGGNKGKDTCSGDSGGPLVVVGPFGPPYLLVGVVSYGPFPCGLSRTPGVYTSIPFYYPWILENIEP